MKVVRMERLGQVGCRKDAALWAVVTSVGCRGAVA